MFPVLPLCFEDEGDEDPSKSTPRSSKLWLKGEFDVRPAMLEKVPLGGGEEGGVVEEWVVDDERWRIR